MTVFNVYKYGGKEFEMRQGLNQYDFLARTYTPDEARFRQPDPLAHETPWLSPYVFCGGDPVNFFDPDGMKRYFVDATGRIVSLETLHPSEQDKYKDDIDEDQIVIVGNDGMVVSASETYPKGTIIKEMKNTALDKNGQILDFTAFVVRGDDVASELFEFLSNVITGTNGIEFSHLKTGVEGDTGKNYITSSHTGGSDYSAGWMFNKQLTFGYTLREWIHSHPVSNYAGGSDVKSRKIVQSATKGMKIKFYVYHVPSKKYIDYTDYEIE